MNGVGRIEFLSRAGEPGTAAWGQTRRDWPLVGLSLVHGVLLACGPPFPVVAVLWWWNTNTISHACLHRPFFRLRLVNRAYSVFLSLLLGVPQTLYGQRHRAHHAGEPFRLRRTGDLVVEAFLVAGLWAVLWSFAPRFFWSVWLPGITGGLALAGLHSHYEHTGGTRSYHGRLYNRLFFNDGYHLEHHRDPNLHWTDLPMAGAGASGSRWPPVLGWLDRPGLEWLERLVLRSRGLQRFMLRTHGRALGACLPDLASVHTVRIVGGGMYPRTAILLGHLLPAATIEVVDASARNLDMARPWLGPEVRLVVGKFDPGNPDGLGPRPDLLVIPLSFDGDRARVYRDPPAGRVLVHDWIWSERSGGVVVSPLLFKKLVLI